MFSWEVEDYKILDNDISFNPDYFFDINTPLDDSVPKDADIIFCLELAEYIWDPVQFHKNIYNLLNTDGIAYISYPTIYPLHNPEGIDSLRYSKNAIAKLLSYSGFKNWEVTPRLATAGISNLGDFYKLEGMHPIKGDEAIYHIGYLVKAIKNGYM